MKIQCPKAESVSAPDVTVTVGADRIARSDGRRRPGHRDRRGRADTEWESLNQGLLW
jgi:hypothetical protein